MLFKLDFQRSEVTDASMTSNLSLFNWEHGEEQRHGRDKDGEKLSVDEVVDVFGDFVQQYAKGVHRWTPLTGGRDAWPDDASRVVQRRIMAMDVAMQMCSAALFDLKKDFSDLARKKLFHGSNGQVLAPETQDPYLEFPFKVPCVPKHRSDIVPDTMDLPAEGDNGRDKADMKTKSSYFNVNFRMPDFPPAKTVRDTMDLCHEEEDGPDKAKLNVKKDTMTNVTSLATATTACVKKEALLRRPSMKKEGRHAEDIFRDRRQDGVQPEDSFDMLPHRSGKSEPGETF